MSDGGLRVMIVEDEFLVATMIEDMLLDGGHTVVGMADDFDSALALAKAERPDMAFLDFQIIGQRTGLDVAVELGRMGIACVFATGNCPSEKARGLAIGCLHKPFTERDLLAAADAARAVMRGQTPSVLPRTMHLL